MTLAEFTAFYPQFAGFTPVVVLSEYARQANSRFSSFTEEDAEEARRLYVAHKLTLYARMALPDGATPTKAQLAAAGQVQRVASKKSRGGVGHLRDRRLLFCLCLHRSGRPHRNGLRPAAAGADQAVWQKCVCALKCRCDENRPETLLPQACRYSIY